MADIGPCISPEIPGAVRLARGGALAAGRRSVGGAVRGVPPPIRRGAKYFTAPADQPTGCGSPFSARHQPCAAAAPGALARPPGAIIRGKTVTTEFANRH